MIFIVRWQDVVGKDNLDKFTKIQRAIVFAERNHQSESEVFGQMKDRQDDAEMWKKKRFLMKFSGYEMFSRNTDLWKRHGWYKPYLDDGELKFLGTAAKDERVYITLPEFLDWKSGVHDDAVERDYYGETKKIVRDLVDHVRPSNGAARTVRTRHRKDIDGDFIPEVDAL